MSFLVGVVLALGLIAAGSMLGWALMALFARSSLVIRGVHLHEILYVLFPLTVGSTTLYAVFQANPGAEPLSGGLYIVTGLTTVGVFEAHNINGLLMGWSGYLPDRMADGLFEVGKPLLVQHSTPRVQALKILRDRPAWEQAPRLRRWILDQTNIQHRLGWVLDNPRVSLYPLFKALIAEDREEEALILVEHKGEVIEQQLSCELGRQLLHSGYPELRELGLRTLKEYSGRTSQEPSMKPATPNNPSENHD